MPEYTAPDRTIDACGILVTGVNQDLHVVSGEKQPVNEEGQQGDERGGSLLGQSEAAHRPPLDAEVRRIQLVHGGQNQHAPAIVAHPGWHCLANEVLAEQPAQNRLIARGIVPPVMCEAKKLELADRQHLGSFPDVGDARRYVVSILSEDWLHVLRVSG
jgi:hypothetical protein